MEKLLGPAVEEISIPPAVIKIISEGPIDEGWSTALAELEKRIQVVEAKTRRSDGFKALADIAPLLENLTGKVQILDGNSMSQS